MEGERKRGARSTILLVVALILLYVLSIGPAWRAWRLGLLSADPKKIDAFYLPLEEGAKRVGLYDELDAYMTLFDP